MVRFSGNGIAALSGGLFSLYVALALLALFVASLPYQRQGDEHALKELAEVHRLLLKDFHDVAKTQQELHAKARDGG